MRVPYGPAVSFAKRGHIVEPPNQRFWVAIDHIPDPSLPIVSWLVDASITILAMDWQEEGNNLPLKLHFFGFKQCLLPRFTRLYMMDCCHQ